MLREEKIPEKQEDKAERDENRVKLGPRQAEDAARLYQRHEGVRHTKRVQNDKKVRFNEKTSLRKASDVDLVRLKLSFLWKFHPSVALDRFASKHITHVHSIFFTYKTAPL